MLKKTLLAILFVSVIGAGGAAVAYQSATPDTENAAEAVISPQSQALAQSNQPEQAQDNQPENPVGAAEGLAGETWQATGIIAALDDFGMDLILESGENVYVELGPPEYWQAQDVALQAGQTLTVIGTINEGMIHATQVQLADGQTLQLRGEDGQPMWSGGVENGQGQSSGSADGERTPDPQAQVDEWITIEGTLMAFQGGSMTIGTPEGELLTFQTGQPRFFAEQGVTFQVGDEIIVVGFYEGEQFSAGEITQVSTGLRVMLRDPNGRPLWAGPGNGNGNGGNH